MWRSMVERDGVWMWEAWSAGEGSARWARVGPRRPDVFEAFLRDGVAILVVVEGPSGDPPAMLQIHDLDLQNGHAQMGFLAPNGLRPDRDVAAFVAAAFRSFPIHKLYVEQLVPRAEDPISPVAQAVVERRLVDDQHVGGGCFLDLVTQAIPRLEGDGSGADIDVIR